MLDGVALLVVLGVGVLDALVEGVGVLQVYCANISKSSAEHLKATEWWVPNYCEQLQDVNFEYIMFGEFSDYVGDVKVGTTLTTGVNLNDMIDDEMMRPEMDAYHKLITTRQKISVKDWRDLCK